MLPFGYVFCVKLIEDCTSFDIITERIAKAII